jgi:hypothetical protein
VGEATFYHIKIKNSGTKDATNLLVSAKLSNNLKVLITKGTEEQAVSPEDHPEEVLFPKIPRLGHGKSMELLIKVEATKVGQASCRVTVMHDELEAKLADEAITRVTDTLRQ